MNKYDRRKTRELQISNSNYYTFSYCEGTLAEHFGIYKKENNGDRELSQDTSGRVKMTIDSERIIRSASKLFYKLKREHEQSKGGGIYKDRFNLAPIGLTQYEVDDKGKIYHVDRPDTELNRYMMGYWFDILGMFVNGPKAYIRMKLLDGSKPRYPKTLLHEEQILLCSELIQMWSYETIEDKRIKILENRYTWINEGYVDYIVPNLIRLPYNNKQITKYVLIDNFPNIDTGSFDIGLQERYDLLETQTETHVDEIKHKHLVTFYEMHIGNPINVSVGFLLEGVKKRMNGMLEIENKLIILSELLNGEPIVRNPPGEDGPYYIFNTELFPKEFIN